MKRKIAVITGTRADYGILYHVLKAIEESENLDLKLIVCGMHLCPDYGLTINEIYKDGFKIEDKFETIFSSDTGSAMAKSIGIAIINFVQCFERIKPDILVVLGDRGEMLAGAIAASHMNIPVAHIHGGEVSGTIDESIRHAITKLSHIHFPATEDSKNRIIKMGEKEENVFVVGAPGLDYIRNTAYLSRTEINKQFGLNDGKFFIMTQHPVTTERDMTDYQIRQILDALIETNIQTMITYPNSDNGGRTIIKAIEEYREKYNIFKTFRNLSQVQYLSLLKYASAMIGNSSSGIIEAASFKLPVLNVGTRQQGRLRTYNVIDVNYDKCSILSGIERVLHDNNYINSLKNCVNPYGDGCSGKRIANILENIVIDRKLIQKRITY